MPARSKKQQMAAGAALAAKRGERSKASLRGASRGMVETMSEQQLRDFRQHQATGPAAQAQRMSAPPCGDGRASGRVIVPSPRGAACAASRRIWRICIPSV